MNDDIYAADVYYHKQCYNHFVDIRTFVEGEDTISNEINMKGVEHFFRKIDRKVVKDKDAYLLSELRKDFSKLVKSLGLMITSVFATHI